jgi:hypothetical protein
MEIAYRQKYQYLLLLHHLLHRRQQQVIYMLLEQRVLSSMEGLPVH